MNIHSSATNINKTHSRSKAVSFSALLSTAISKLTKYGKNTNSEFWKGTELKQDPVWFIQAHGIYAFKPGWWASVSGGYAYGGNAYLDDVWKLNVRARYIALSLGVSISAHQSLKFVYFTKDTHVSSGGNTDALLAAWSINWGM